MKPKLCNQAMHLLLSNLRNYLRNSNYYLYISNDNNIDHRYYASNNNKLVIFCHKFTVFYYSLPFMMSLLSPVTLFYFIILLWFLLICFTCPLCYTYLLLISLLVYFCLFILFICNVILFIIPHI